MWTVTTSARSVRSKEKTTPASTIEAGVGKKEKLLLLSGTSVDCVEEFCYLGDMLSSGGGAGEA